MNFTTTVTERDKKLLHFLAVFVIVVGFLGWVLLPGLEKSRELEERLFDLQMQKMDMEARLVTLPSLEEENKRLLEEYEKLGETFYPVNRSQDAEREITKILTSCGLKSLSLEMTVAEDGFLIEPFRYSAMYEELLENTEEGAEEETASEEKLPAAESIKGAAVDIRALGTREQIQEALDLFWRSGIPLRIESYTIKEQTEGAFLLEASLEAELVETE